MDKQVYSFQAESEKIQWMKEMMGKFRILLFSILSNRINS